MWAAFIGRAFLDMDPLVVPAGTEFGSQIQTSYFWDDVKQCGVCALWFGGEQGGLPALVDLHGSFLNPLVALVTILFGVVNGAKAMLVLSIWLTGVAQWWIAGSSTVGAVPRLFTAAVCRLRRSPCVAHAIRHIPCT